MGLILFPGDGDAGSPEVAWSYTGFAAFRRHLAQAEGFALSEMRGFGGERPWSGASTSLVPLFDRPDGGGGELSPTECAALLPRLEAIADQWRSAVDVPREHAEAARRLTDVLRFCVAKDVELLFL
ncbi:hypothetical protein ABZ135_10645 [Streptomyces sp. NPDC006339]|uniref:hypothetical protein n=1 Tax=Streptomyces sp. NPDC006339 TaxID=3156755 RepID=UPI0033A2F3AA